MKLIVEPSTKDYTSYINNFCDGFLLGLDDFCNGFKVTHTIKEINLLKQTYQDKEIFVSINIPIYDEFIDTVKEILKELEKIKVTGILFYDLAILELKQELNLDIDLVWNQTHMVTNSKTCNFYYAEGVKYAYISSEITLEEMLEIKKNSKISCMALLLGYPICSLSKRKLLSNFYQFLGKDVKKNLLIKEPVSNQEYNLIEDNTGTVFYYNKLLNGSKPYLKLLKNNFDYGVLKEDIDHDKFLKVLQSYAWMKDNYYNVIEEEKNNWLANVNKLIGSRDTGFFYRKTIFKVKKK